jgi:xanthine/uracil/vitamin C permease (AzgA family)
MSEHDPLIERTERAERATRAANLFDLRRIIGGVFLVWGVLLVILGATDSDAEIQKAAGVNINLWAGLGMLVLSALFLVWAFTRPLGEELREAAKGEPAGPPGA